MHHRDHNRLVEKARRVWDRERYRAHADREENYRDDKEGDGKAPDPERIGVRRARLRMIRHLTGGAVRIRMR